MSDPLTTALLDLDEATVLRLVKEGLEAGQEPLAILTSCREGMALVGKRYEAGEYFVSELIMAGEVFKGAVALMGSRLAAEGTATRGQVVIGTVKGDIHDIGKDIVVTLLRSANYDVHDLGVDVPVSKFVDTVKETGARVVGLSGLLTTSFDSMKEIVDALAAAGLRAHLKVMVGGGPVTDQVRAYVGADAFGHDAQVATNLVNEWIGG